MQVQYLQQEISTLLKMFLALHALGSQSQMYFVAAATSQNQRTLFTQSKVAPD
jgi:hypothetical protein